MGSRLKTMKQHGGEGESAYKKQSNDSKLVQHGGEGTAIKSKSNSKLWKGDSKHRGPGANP